MELDIAGDLELYLEVDNERMHCNENEICSQTDKCFLSVFRLRKGLFSGVLGYFTSIIDLYFG